MNTDFDTLQVVTTIPVGGHHPIHLLFIEADEDRPLTLREGVICGFESLVQMQTYLGTVSDRMFNEARPPTPDDHFPFDPWQCMQMLEARDFDRPGAYDVLFWTATFGIIVARYLGIELPRQYHEALYTCADVLTFESDVHAWIDPIESNIGQVVEAFGLLGALVYARIEMVSEAK